MPRAQPQATTRPHRPPYRGHIEAPEAVEDTDPDNDQGVTMGQTHAARAQREEERLTRFGAPDRRFKGQRDLPEAGNSNYTQPRQGGVVDEVHVTLDGRPDRRFKENRALSQDEVIARQIEVLQAQRRH